MRNDAVLEKMEPRWILVLSIGKETVENYGVDYEERRLRKEDTHGVY